MKQWFARWLSSLGLMFTATTLLYLVFCLAFRQDAVPARQLWSFLLFSAAGTLIQGLCFSERVFRKMRYTRRLLLFAALFFPLLAAAAYAFQWFPMTWASWLIFTGIFLVIFAGMTLGFELYYRAAGKKYDGLLGQYRRARQGREE